MPDCLKFRQIIAGWTPSVSQPGNFSTKVGAIRLLCPGWTTSVLKNLQLLSKKSSDTNSYEFLLRQVCPFIKGVAQHQRDRLFRERVRNHLMGIHKRIKNQDPTLVSPVFSGKGPNGEPLTGHTHAFYLPMDEDGDGRLDHLLVYAVHPFESSELMALDRLRSVWQPGGRPDVNFVLVSLSAEVPRQKASRWVSATPFVTSRHYRKGRGDYGDWLMGEIAKECNFHGLPSPSSVEWIPHTLHTVHPIRWMEFYRGRKNEPPLPGYGCIITFNEPVAGPFAIGSGCHFGLGLFIPFPES